MGPPLIRSVRFLDPRPQEGAPARIRVEMDDGSASSFTVSTPAAVSGRMAAEGRDFLFMEPVVFVRSLEEPVVREAVEAMAAEKAGYWLRYYNSRPGGAQSSARSGGPSGRQGSRPPGAQSSGKRRPRR